MDTKQSESQPRRHLRFSLGMLLALVACVCFFLGGNILGQRQATWTLMRKFPTSTKTYYVEDLVMDTKSGASGPAGAGGGVQADFDSLMNKIQQRCAPETWEDTGGPSRISPFPLNLSLIVSANDLVHREIEELLTKLRTEKFGPEFEAHLPTGMREAIAKAKRRTSQKTYVVSDLVGEHAPDELRESGGTDADALVGFIKKSFSSNEWAPVGPSDISTSASKTYIHIDGTPYIHEAVADLLAQMRRSRLRHESEPLASSDMIDESLDRE